LFKYIQTFFLDPAAVKSASEASITQIGLYFRAKPNAINNKSGIVNPGVEVSLVPCVQGIPQIQQQGTIRPPEPTEHGARFSPRFEIARLEYGQITATSDASVETIFKFNNPVQLLTGFEYGIAIKYDGTEDFVLWYSRQNDNLIGTTTKSPGASSKYVGNLFDYVGPPNVNINVTTPTASANTNATTSTNTNANLPTLTPDGSYLSANWKPISDVDLKFNVYVARYFHSGFPVSSNSSIQADPRFANRFQDDFPPVKLAGNVVQITAPAETQEYFQIDVVHSTFSRIVAGDLVYQPQPYYPASQKTPITISCNTSSLLVTANGNYTFSNSTTFNNANGFHTIYQLGQPEYIVIDHGAFVDVRQVVGVQSNTQVIIDHPPSVANAVAKFYKAPVGRLAGLSDTYIQGQDQNILVLTRSNANSTLRFVNNYITGTTINAGGSGYSNGDTVTITGFESTTTIKGGFAAKLLLTTNSTGGITNTFVANAGCGFTYPTRLVGANVVYANSTGGSSSGTGANISFTIGSYLYCDQEPSVVFANVVCTDLLASRIKPEITVNNPLGTAFTVTHRGLFYSTPDANNASGRATLVYENPSVTDIPVKIFKATAIGDDDVVATCMPSRSNQMVTVFANGAIANSAVIGKSYSNAAVYLFDVSSNNDYMCPFIEPEIARSHYSKYVINNDYTLENTNYGNAYAKHVTTKVNLNTDQFAEDLLFYVTAYRPAGTDLKVYARVQNTSKDNDAFDDKDWTLLEQVDGIGVYSSAIDDTDYVELTYNFSNCPNNHVISGSVTVTDSSNLQIAGAGTTFTTDLANGDLVVITNPLFSQNSFFVGVVNNVTNNTFLTLQAPTANLGVVGVGLQIAKVDFPKQAFNAVMEANVMAYFTDDESKVETYDTMQFKIVFLSNNDILVPKIDDIRAVAVSA
jgi:hypothetical protein